MSDFSKFEYHIPETLEQAWALFQGADRAVFLAGGTDYLPLLKSGLKNPRRVIGLRRIPYLGKVERRPEGLFVGAALTLAELDRVSPIREHFPALGRAAAFVASPQIRNVATLAGNLLQDRRCMYFNQSADWRRSLDPCFKTGGKACLQAPRSRSCRAVYHSDLAPLLLALEARVECFDQNGFSLISVKELVAAHVALNGGIEKEKILVTGFMLPPLPQGSRLQFVKQSARASLDFAVLNAALCFRPASGKTPGGLKLVVGAVAPEPVELTETEQFVQEQSPALASLKEILTEKALAELENKCALIRDTGISLKARKKAFGAVGRLIEKWHTDLAQRT